MVRMLDIFFSLLAIVILSPLLLPSIILLRLTGEGEVFFKQERIGRAGKKFNVLKFATMLKNSPAIGTGTITIKNDPRVLPVGKFLRKTKINELPQLFNIILGEMSLIGPRPLTIETFTAYTEETQNLIKQVRPGLSGVGSIVFRNEEAFLQEAEDSKQFYIRYIAPFKGELESWYISRQSVFLYFCMIFLTVYVVLNPSSKIFWKLFSSAPKPPKALNNLFQH